MPEARLKARINDLEERMLRLDPVTHSLETIDHTHSQENKGDHYFVKSWMDIDGAGTIVRLMFITPNTLKRIHAQAHIAGEAEFTIEIYEGITTSNDGTPVPRFNNDRDSANISGLLPFSGPNVTDEGTLLWATKVGSGKNASVSPGLNYKIIAKRNSKYMFKITKVATSSHWLDFDFWWHEHAPRS